MFRIPSLSSFEKFSLIFDLKRRSVTLRTVTYGLGTSVFRNIVEFLHSLPRFSWFGKASEVITSLTMSSLNSILISFRDRSEDIRPNRTSNIFR